MSSSEDSASQPRLYDELAHWWPLLSPPEEYAEECLIFADVLKTHGSPDPRTLLELGSGGGHTASHLKRHFRVTLVDLSPQMLSVSRALNPECEHAEGDMRSFRSGQMYDRVLIHDAICYMTNEQDLRLSIETAYAHCRPGGAALFIPDHVRDTFRPGTAHGGIDGDARAMRYLEWTYDPDPTDSIYTVDYAFLLRETDGSIRVEHERHLEGLFSRETWQRLINEVGFACVDAPFARLEDGSLLPLFVGVWAPPCPG